MNVLVAYATAHGSTAAIAERIAARLRARAPGLRVDVIPVSPDVDPSRYDAVLLGSAIHGQAWLPEAADFIFDHGPALRARPLWMFSVGMPAAMPRAFRRWTTTESETVLRPFAASLRPRGSHLFSGVFRKEHVPGLGRVIFRLLGGRYGDFRDPVEIDAWADAVFDELMRESAARETPEERPPPPTP